MKTIRVGSRDSRLAVIQSELVMAAIAQHHPEVKLELVTMKTTGDKILDRTLDKIGGKGLFVKELDAALLENRVDITVHSCKDLPADIDPAIPLLGFTRREASADVLVLPQGVETLDESKPIGCASARRTLQIQKLYPNMTVAPIRGNLQTRLRKLDEGQYSALVLAEAGLNRLGLQSRIARQFTPEEMLPAACQGILAIQGRAGEDASYLEGVLDEEANWCALAERAFIRRLDGGCSSPVAAFAQLEGDTLTVEGFYVDQQNQTYRATKTGTKEEGQAMAVALADQLKGEHP